MQKTLYTLLVAFLYMSPAMAQLSIQAGYGFHTPPMQVAGDFTVYDARKVMDNPTVLTEKDRRWELLLNVPLQKGYWSLQTGIARMGINYSKMNSIRVDGFGVGMSTFYRHRISQWQLPVRLERNLLEGKSLQLGVFGGLALTYNRFGININSTGANRNGDEVYSHEITSKERIQRSFGTLGELGIKAELMLYEGLWITASGLYQQGFYKFHQADFQYSFTNSRSNERQDVDFSMFSRGTNLSVNFGLRYMFKKGSKDQ